MPPGVHLSKKKIFQILVCPDVLEDISLMTCHNSI